MTNAIEKRMDTVQSNLNCKRIINEWVTTHKKWSFFNDEKNDDWQLQWI